MGMSAEDRVVVNLQLRGLQAVVFNVNGGGNASAMSDLGKPIYASYSKVARMLPGLTMTTDPDGSVVPFSALMYRCFLVVMSMMFVDFNPSEYVNALPWQTMQRWIGLGTPVSPHPDRNACIMPRASRPVNPQRRPVTSQRTLNKNNYIIMHIGYDAQDQYVNVDVHRLVGWMELGPPVIASPPPALVNKNSELVAMHLCHNRACINPYHIVWGTWAVNLAESKQYKHDRKKKRRVDVWVENVAGASQGVEEACT
jgi:hypothetical protein